jgi:hypothetical protein
MACADGSSRLLSCLRLFCIAFVVTFIGVAANLWMLQRLSTFFEQRHEVTEPSDEASRFPVLASTAVPSPRALSR